MAGRDEMTKLFVDEWQVSLYQFAFQNGFLKAISIYARHYSTSPKRTESSDSSKSRIRHLYNRYLPQNDPAVRLACATFVAQVLGDVHQVALIATGDAHGVVERTCEKRCALYL